MKTKYVVAVGHTLTRTAELPELLPPQDDRVTIITAKGALRHQTEHRGERLYIACRAYSLSKYRPFEVIECVGGHEPPKEIDQEYVAALDMLDEAIQRIRERQSEILRAAYARGRVLTRADCKNAPKEAA